MLGYERTEDGCRFQVRAPYCQRVELILYEGIETWRHSLYPMERQGDVFSTEFPFSWDEKSYTFLLDGELEITDPYGKGVNIRSTRSIAFDEIPSPEGFQEDSPISVKMEEAIIYETHLKDFSMHKSGGFQFPGKFKAFTESDPNRQVNRGVDHLVELGITHVHLLPVFDFVTMAEEPQRYEEDNNYNWGYDPEHFFCLYNGYGSNPFDVGETMIEFKEMIKTLHSKGIGVILDVVYNHTYRSKDSNLFLLSGGEYYRTDEKGELSNGSGVGNEIKTEHPHMRQLIIDSLTYWAREFHIDGFRFDLMGLIDKVTLQQAEEELRKINPEILLYGEPWTAGETVLAEEEKWTARDIPNFALFNDSFRDGVRGNVFGDSFGFVQGNMGEMERVFQGLIGSVDFHGIQGKFDDSTQSMNYINCHDDYILFDQIEKSLKGVSLDELALRNRFALSLLLLAQGPILWCGGNEFLHSKQGETNTYAGPTSINALNWSQKWKHYGTFNYIKELIDLRKSYPNFHLKNSEEIQSKIQVSYKENGVIIYSITEKGKSLYIIVNGRNETIRVRDYLYFLEEKEKIFPKNGIAMYFTKNQNNEVPRLSIAIYE